MRFATALLFFLVLSSAPCRGDDAKDGWIEPMRQVHARFRGTPGTFAHFGDSITVTRAFWSPLAYEPKGLDAAPAKDLARVKAHQHTECWDKWKGPDYGNEGGMTIRWAHENADRWLKKLNPEAVLLMFGTNDLTQLDEKEYTAKTRDVIQRCLDNGSVVIVSTIPPRAGLLDKSRRFAQAVRGVGRELHVPVVDYFGEVLRRRPDDWDGSLAKFKDAPGSEYEVPTLIARDGVHPSNPRRYQTYDAEGLSHNGYLLRNYLVLRAYAEVIDKVLDADGGASLRKAVTFYASFDDEVRGDAGGGTLTPGTRYNRGTQPGQFVFEKEIDRKVFRIAKGRGVAGGALEVTDVLPRNGRVYFPAKGNLAYRAGGWSGAASFWLSTDPNKLLKTKFCDPLQITQKGSNNGGLWVDFNDARPRDLRHGAFPAVPEGKTSIKEEDPAAPMVRVKAIDWEAGAWHHVALSWQNFDTGKPDAVSTLYIDGRRIGQIKDRPLAMAWDLEKAGIYVAISYIGLMDELALFNRALSDEDVRMLHQQPNLCAALKPAGAPKTSQVAPKSQDGNWPAWRGPEGTGVSAEKKLPLKWSASENVRWKVPLPGPGNSTPIIWGDRVFLTQAFEGGKRRGVIALARADGTKLWQQEVACATTETTHPQNPPCSASPITDGAAVYANFASAGIVAYDVEGKRLWHRELGPVLHKWGNGPSPVLYGDLLIVFHGPGEPSVLMALDKRTGKTVWKKEETAINSPIFGSWSTPVIVRAGDHDELIMPLPGERIGGDGEFKGYDPTTGKELWRCRGLGNEIYAMPIVSAAGDVVIGISGHNGPLMALRPGGTGDVTSTHRLWRQAEKNPQRIGCGVLHAGRVFLADAPGLVECLDAKTGEALWKERLTGNLWGSILAADDKLYVTNLEGTTFVLAAGPKFEVLARNEIKETTYAAPAVAGGDLFLRTYENLYCIGEKQQRLRGR